MSDLTATENIEEAKNKYRELIKNNVAAWSELILANTALTEEGLSNFASRADEFKAVVARNIVYETRILSSAHHQVDDEKVKPLFDFYFNHYEVKDLSEQVKYLRELFPGLGSSDEALARKPLPEGAEGYFAIPRWEALAPTYEEALEKMFEKLHDTFVWDVCDDSRVGRFFNYRTGRLGEKYLRANDRSAAMWKSLCESQKGYDILTVPAQFGLLHAGESADYVRKTMRKEEFGLSTFAVGAMLLNHRRRVVEYDDLWMDCPGDEYSLYGDGKFTETPQYLFSMGQTEFDVINYERFRSGSVTGFLTL